MAKRIFYDEDARRRVLAGAEIVYKTVSGTLGPKGQNVVMGKQGLPPTISHDGVSVARAISVEDVDDETLGYSVGIELIKAAANKTDKIGDGTTTTSILTYHILKEANKLIAAGHNPMALRKQIESVALAIIKMLDSYSEDIVGKPKKVVEVATISAGDSEIGQLIADIMNEIGTEGTVAVEVGQGLDLESEITRGYSFGKGYVSPYMATNKSTMEAIYRHVPILVTDAKLTSAQDLIPLLEALNTAKKRELVIIADDITGDALGMIVFNQLKGAFNCAVVKAPSYGNRRQETLEDIAVITGATFLSTERGSSITEAKITDLGAAKQVIVTADNTTIIDGEGAPEDIASRSEQLDALVDTTKSAFDREFFERRRASLHGKVAVIRVGGATETEIEEKKFRVEDAVYATKAALESGIVAGGEITLVNVAHNLPKADESDKSYYTAARRIMRNALEQPFRILLANSGLSADEFLYQVRAKTGYGLDVTSDSTALKDMKKIGVIDPTEVVKGAVQGAVSIASTALTMGSLICDMPERTEEKPASVGGLV